MCSAAAMVRIGYCHLALGDEETAVEWLERALAEHPDNEYSKGARRALEKRQSSPVASRAPQHFAPGAQVFL
jgi:TolA-binding protein